MVVVFLASIIPGRSLKVWLASAGRISDSECCVMNNLEYAGRASVGYSIVVAGEEVQTWGVYIHFSESRLPCRARVFFPIFLCHVSLGDSSFGCFVLGALHAHSPMGVRRVVKSTCLRPECS